MNQSSSQNHLFDELAFVLLSFDRQLNIRSVNRAGLNFLGYLRAEQLLGQPLKMLVPADHWHSDRIEVAVMMLEQGQTPAPMEFDLLCRDGRRVPMVWCVDQAAALSDRAAPILLTGFEATSIRYNQNAATLFQSVAENYSGSILITDEQMRILYANPAAERIMGYPFGELLGHSIAEFRSGKMPDEVYHQLAETLARRELWRGEFINRRKDGGLYVESKTIAAITDHENEVRFYFAIGEDVSQRQQYEQQIERLMMFDQLTGLPNRAAFMRELTAGLESARLGQQQMGLLHIDLDDFKKTKAAFGSDVSDHVLTETAVRLKEILRPTDVVARLSGDEFVLLLGSTEAGIDAEIQKVAGRILDSIRRPYTLADHSITLSASIGIACYPEGGRSAQELLSNAMSATLRAKGGGGNDVRLFEAAMATVEVQRRELVLALERSEMRLYYQPQLSLSSGGIIGVEALIRWQHPLRGMVPPGEFIPLAEESNQIIEIGEWVLVEACRQMRAWLDTGLPPLKVAINLAARHFGQSTLPESIADALAAHRLDPHFLEIEITESAMMHDMNAAIRNMEQLKALGVRISLDDFGTGHSSMAHLSRFPIDVVKIDQSFVRDIITNPASAAVAQATIAMSHKLGKTVLAEGVETVEQMTYLRRSECDEMQGYYFSRPVPADEISLMLQQDLRIQHDPQQDERARDTLLLIDDEASILSALRRTLRREGYTILTAQSAAAGFALLATNPVHVIICDQHMSEMTGTQFLAQAKILYPQTVRIVLSGYSEIASVTDAINKGAAYRFLSKPWNDEQLKQEIRGALRHWRELYAKNPGETGKTIGV